MNWFKQHWDTALATIFLLGFTVIAITSSWGDSTIIDELSHIGAGYSYVTQHDMRINPEHPPLVKDLAGLMLLPLRLDFPTDTTAWQTDVNGQWAQGEFFIYRYNENPELITQLARIPILVLAILLGIALFKWAKHSYGKVTAVITLGLLVTSPTIIAHARFVTTDIAAALGFVVSISLFLAVLPSRSWRRWLMFGVVLGIAQLLKFSLILLAPSYVLLFLAWWFAQRLNFTDALRLAGKLLVSSCVALGVIWLVYAWNTYNMPADKTLADAKAQIDSHVVRPLVEFNYTLLRNPITRPLGVYMEGVMMVSMRSAGGNTGYLLGEVTNKGWWQYFPILYVVKEQLVLHLLTLLVIITGIYRVTWPRRLRKPNFSKLREWVKQHFVAIACFTVISVYWVVSVRSPLNIGIRHVLPTFPFIYLLVARGLAVWLGDAYKRWSLKLATIVLAGIWLVTTVVMTFPYYLSFYNVLGGGTQNGYQVAVDSNYDWGQDLKRLSAYVKARPTEQFYVDYFGSSTVNYSPVRYWLGDQFIEWHSFSGKPPSGSKVVVSLTFYMNTVAKATKGFPAYKEIDSFPWLKGLTPIDRVGTSLLVFQIP